MNELHRTTAPRGPVFGLDGAWTGPRRGVDREMCTDFTNTTLTSVHLSARMMIAAKTAVRLYHTVLQVDEYPRQMQVMK